MFLHEPRCHQKPIRKEPKNRRRKRKKKRDRIRKKIENREKKTKKERERKTKNEKNDQGLCRAFLLASDEPRPANSLDSLEGKGAEDEATRSFSDSGDGIVDVDEAPLLPALLAAATARRRSPLLPRRLIRLPVFDDDADPDDAEAEADAEAAAAAAAAAAFVAADLSILFRKGLGRFSSSAKSYSGEGWFRGTGIGSGFTRTAAAAAAAAARFELLDDGRRCGWGRGLG